LSTIGSTWLCRRMRKRQRARRMNRGYSGQAAAIRNPIFGK
jgi:hypothetical protein